VACGRFARVEDVSLITKSEHRRKISREALIDLLGDLCGCACVSASFAATVSLTPPCDSYMAKIAIDASDTAKGAVTVSSLEFFLDFIKVGLGVQLLQQIQMYAIAATTLQYYRTEPRLELFAIWTGLIDQPSYSIFTSILTLSLIRDVIRPPEVRLDVLLSLNPRWHGVFTYLVSHR
jgi:hypothetical protein